MTNSAYAKNNGDGLIVFCDEAGKECASLRE